VHYPFIIIYHCDEMSKDWVNDTWPWKGEDRCRPFNLSHYLKCSSIYFAIADSVDLDYVVVDVE